MKLFEEVKNRNLESGIGIRLRVLSKSFNATMINFEFCHQLKLGKISYEQSIFDDRR